MESMLESRLESVNRTYFCFPALPSVRWSRGRVLPRYRKITFGTYDFKRNEIRIHPLLKNSGVPSAVLDYVLFHELLHYEDRDRLKEMAPPVSWPLFRGRSGRRRVHNRCFHDREKEFPGKEEACRWMRRFVKGEIPLTH